MEDDLHTCFIYVFATKWFELALFESTSALRIYRFRDASKLSHAYIIAQAARKTDPQTGTGVRKTWAYIGEETQKQRTTVPL